MSSITLFRGDSYPIIFTLKDKITTLPLNLTGATFKLTVDTRKDPTDGTTKVFDVVGVLTATPIDGKVSFTPTTVNTGTIGKYFYDVQMTTGANIRTVVKDTFTITMDITK